MFNLLNKAAKKETKNQSFEIAPNYLSIGEKARLIVSVTDAKAPSIRYNNIKLAPRQNIALPYKWDGLFWPSSVGWNTITINKKPQNIFVYNKTDWQSLKNSQKLISTTDFVANKSLANSNSKEIDYLSEEELSKWWFFGLFLLSASFLWYEQRFLLNK